MRSKKFEIKNGRIFYRDELVFRTVFHELLWKLTMRKKGCTVRELINE
ncbi:hypothetical protein [Dethiothermospora halolimnae]